MNKKLITLAVFLFSSVASAASTDTTVNLVNANGTDQKIGSITITETEYGLLFTPHLSSLPAGIHGFH
ncbi:superoxide dismutase [Cu-Zn] SodC2, partial [Salmonella enterica subsp. enterica]|nr:superoxide dismutase [Cu-Zn] SodC2 [Salmonella enterica subsp. enterica]